MTSFSLAGGFALIWLPLLQISGPVAYPSTLISQNIINGDNTSNFGDITDTQSNVNPQIICMMQEFCYMHQW